MRDRYVAALVRQPGGDALGDVDRAMTGQAGAADRGEMVR